MKNNVIAWWYNPRNGQVHKIGKFANAGYREFVPPTAGIHNDWILILDDKKTKFEGWQ